MKVGFCSFSTFKLCITGIIIFKLISDPRTKDFYISAKPIQLFAIIALYQLFVLKWGPNLMKNRQPFNIDKIIIVFDVCQVVCCGSLFYVVS